MKKTKTLLLFMAIFLINGCSNHQDHVDIQLDLYSSYGTMTQQKKNAILSETQIAQANYKSIVVILGITGSLERCGFLRLPCLTNDFITQEIKATIDPQTHSISFKIPEYIKWLYKLESIAYSLPDPDQKSSDSLPGHQLEIRRTDALDIYVRQQQAVSVGTAYEGLQGTLTISSKDFAEFQYIPDVIASDNQKPPYHFARHHRYAGYMDNANIRTIPNAQTFDYTEKIVKSIPNIETVYEAKKYTAELDHQFFENYVIRAKLKENETCKAYGDFEYNLFYINQKLVNLKTVITDMQDCKTHYRSFSRFENDQIEHYDHDINDNKTNQFNYAEWNYLCPKKIESRLGNCELKKPSTKDIENLEKNARQVKQWFST